MKDDRVSCSRWNLELGTIKTCNVEDDVLDRLGDGVERIGAGVDVDVVHPLFSLHRLVPCSSHAQQNQKYRLHLRFIPVK